MLLFLKEELDGIEETEEELRTILEHVTALEDILKGSKKAVYYIFLTLILFMTLYRVNFSTGSSEDLKRAGVKRKRLVFALAKITNLTKGLTSDAETQFERSTHALTWMCVLRESPLRLAV